MIRIIPSIASANQLELRNEMTRVQSIGRLHIDIEDGNFIDNITFGKKTVKAIANLFQGSLDVHLLTTNPEAYLDWISELEIDAICAHIEALPYPKRFLCRARRLGMKAGLAFNIKVPPEETIPYINDLDYIIVMTSEPDDGTQTFFSCSFDRVAQFRRLLGPDVEIWCDGGVSPQHIKDLHSAGMDAAVMGRAVFSSNNPEEAIRNFERSMI